MSDPDLVITSRKDDVDVDTPNNEQIVVIAEFVGINDAARVAANAAAAQEAADAAAASQTAAALSEANANTFASAAADSKTAAEAASAQAITSESNAATSAEAAAASETNAAASETAAASSATASASSETNAAASEAAAADSAAAAASSASDAAAAASSVGSLVTPQAANIIFSGPSAGGSAMPAFRAMVDADIPTTLSSDRGLTGKIGIGAAATANAQLNVQKSSDNTAYASSITASLQASDHSQFYNSHASGSYVSLFLRAQNASGRIMLLNTAASTGNFVWQLRNGGSTTAEVMRLTAAGALSVLDPITTRKNFGLGAISVADYGADPTGVTDASTAFQNAVNAAIDADAGVNKIARVLVPAGKYAGDLSGLSFTHGAYTVDRVVFHHLGPVQYSGTAPKTDIMFGTFTSGSGRVPSWKGALMLYKDSAEYANDSNFDTYNLRIRRIARTDRTGGSANSQPLQIESWTYWGYNGNQYGAVFETVRGERADANAGRQVPNYGSSVAPAETANLVGMDIHVDNYWQHSNLSVCLALDIRATDYTVTRSSVGGPLNTIECSLECYKDDDGGGAGGAGAYRKALMVAIKNRDGFDDRGTTDGLTAYGAAGIVITNQNTGVSGPAYWYRGIWMSPKTNNGGLKTGLQIDDFEDYGILLSESARATAPIADVRISRTAIPHIQLFRNGTSTNLALLKWNALNGSSAETTYAQLQGGAITTTAGSEKGRLTVSAMNGAAGTAALTVVAYFQQGLVVGAPTGADKGPGSVNAQAVYDDNTLLTCYPVQQWLDGKIDGEYWDQFAPAGQRHERARAFDPMLLDADYYEQKMRQLRRAPAFPSPEEWKSGSLSTGELIQRLWETVEVQSIHIAAMNARLKQAEVAL